jgi:uncharacterized membrane protein
MTAYQSICFLIFLWCFALVGLTVYFASQAPDRKRKPEPVKRVVKRKKKKQGRRKAKRRPPTVKAAKSQPPKAPPLNELDEALLSRYFVKKRFANKEK